MHFWRRGERTRRQGKHFLDMAIKLSSGGEQAVLAGSRLGCETIPDFTLHHEHDGCKVFSISEEAKQNVGGDEIRKIADDFYRFGLVIYSGTSAARFGSEKGVEINGENVAFDNFDVRSQRKFHAQLGRENAIQFDGNQPPCSSREQGSQGAASGSDFEHRALR